MGLSYHSNGTLSIVLAGQNDYDSIRPLRGHWGHIRARYRAGGSAVDETFGQMVRRFRKARRLTQQRLAQLAEIDQSTVSQVELDKGERTVRIVTNLAKVFDQEPLEWLDKAGVVDLPEEMPAQLRPVARDSDSMSVAQMVAQVEAWGGEHFERQRETHKARLSVEAYEAWCVNLYRLQESVAQLALDMT